MPVPSTIADLSTTAASNSPQGSESPTEGDNYIRALSAIVAQEHADFADAASASKGAKLVGYTPSLSYASGLGAFLNSVYAKTAAEASATVTPTNYAYPPLDVRRYGAAVDNSADDTSEIGVALGVADETVSGGQGNAITIPQGVAVVSSSLNIPNRVAIKGANKRGTVLKAVGHTGPYMFTVDNGTSSMFDNPLQDLTLDCNDVASLGGVLSDAWQEGGGLRNVLINKFRTYGVRFQNGDGGAALCEISQSEIFGSNVAAGTAGILVDQISATGNFMLKVRDTTVSGGSSFVLPKGIDIVKDSLHCQSVHFEYCTSGIYLDGVGHHVLIGVTGGPSVTNVVEIASTFTGSLWMIGCHRSGATNLLKDNRTGGMGTVTSLDFPLVLPGAGVVFGPGQVNSAGVFDGGTASPAVTNCYGVTSITRNATGDFTVTEARARPSAYCSPQVSVNIDNARVRVDLLGTTTFQIKVFDSAGAAVNPNEVKFTNTRVA